MKSIEYLSSPQLIEALRLWVGWEGFKPDRDDQRVAERYGLEASALLRLMKSLEEDFYASNAHIVAKDLADMAALASEDFVRKHPTVSPEIVKLFAWCYTFDYK